MELSCWISFWSRWDPGRTALRFEGTEVSYANLDAAIGVRAYELRRAGVIKGDRVCYLGPNRPELLELLFACSRVGAIFVPLNARMPPQELRVFIDQSQPRLLFADDGFLEVGYASTAGADLRELTRPFVEEYLPSAPAGDDAPVLIAYTSGTTGTPKGVVLTNDALLANAMNAQATLGLDPSDHVLTVIPMFHVGGLNILTTPALIAGATVTIHRAFDAGAFLREVATAGATLSVVVPPVSLALIAHEEWFSTDVSSLRALLIGSTMVPDEAMAPWFDRGIPVCQVYGLTETCPAATVVPPQHAAQNRSSAGMPVPSCEVSVLDTEGHQLPRGQLGDVALRGRTVFREYWNNPQATADAFLASWFRTGDAGYIDGQGFLHITERLKDIIVVGGSNVYPADVETVLLADPRIHEAAVVGRPHDELGEVPTAFIVADTALTSKDVRALLQGAVAGYKHPREVTFLDKLPKSALGKVQRSVLRKMATAEGAARG